jgi:hypothetical protein
MSPSVSDDLQVSQHLSRMKELVGNGQLGRVVTR